MKREMIKSAGLKDGMEVQISVRGVNYKATYLQRTNTFKVKDLGLEFLTESAFINWTRAAA